MSGQLDRRRRNLPLTTGWGWLALLRVGLGLTMAVYVLTYRPLPGFPAPAYLKLAALAAAAIPLVLGLTQLIPKFRMSRTLALAAVPLDVAAVFATLALYSFDPRRYLVAMVVVVQAEAGVVLGIRAGLAVWAVTAGGYVLVEAVSAAASGTPVEVAETALRIGAGLVLALGGGFMSEELSGERRRRLAEREREMLQLREAEERYRSLVEMVPVVIYIGSVGADGAITYISPQIEELTGYRPEQWTADRQFWARRLHPEDQERTLAERARTVRTKEPFQEEYRLIAADGREVWLRDEAVLIRDEQKKPRFWQGVLVDITDRKQAEAEVSFLAYHDKLTDLPNRVMFEEVMDVALARAKRNDTAAAVLYLDLDNFKEVNDSLGHAAGDELLREVAGRLKEAVREADVVARQGGDEFLVLLADLGRGADPAGVPLAEVLAVAVADRIHDALRRPFDLGGTAFDITASIGISLFPLTAKDAGALSQQADAAMYRSKRARPGGSVVFRPA